MTLDQIWTRLKRWAILESEGDLSASRWVDYYEALYQAKLKEGNDVQHPKRHIP